MNIVAKEIEMPRSEAGKCVSEKEYWEKYYEYVGESDFKYEWNNGILEEKPGADFLASQMYRWFFLLIDKYLSVHPVAKLIGLDIGFRLELPDKIAIRKPDLALISNSNPVDIVGHDCWFKGIYDLCIEFLIDFEPWEEERDTFQKKQEYEQAGVQEYFILDRESKKTAFYCLNEYGRYSPIPQQPEGVIESEVLPDFRFRIDDLYTRPDPLDRINDSVYDSYILLYHQTLLKKLKKPEKELKKPKKNLKSIIKKPKPFDKRD